MMCIRSYSFTAGSGNSQDAHNIRAGTYPDYPMGPGGVPGVPGGVPGQVHPAGMHAAGQMRPGQYHDPNMPPHQQVNFASL